MLKINDLPLKSINTSGFNGNVVVTLSSPYFISPSTIQVGILQITNKSSIQSMNWFVMPAYEEVLPELAVTQNSVSFEEAYYFGGMVLQLSVLLKNGQYQYYYVPVDLEGIPPFEAACEHSGNWLSFNTFSSRVTVEVDNSSIGEIIFDDLSLYSEVYTDDAIRIQYYYDEDNGLNTLTVRSNFTYTSFYTPKTIKFIPLSTEDLYSISTDLSNFPFIFDGDGYTDTVDLSSLPYNTNEYFIANNCCFDYNEK